MHSHTTPPLNKSWRQRPTRRQLYGHLPPITKTIQVRRTRHAGHIWRSNDELISDVLLWTPAYGQAKAGWPARTYLQQLSEDMGCSPEDLPQAMNDWEKLRQRTMDIRASGTTWWWWYIYIYIYSGEGWRGGSKGSISFPYRITWSLLIQMISTFNSVCWNNSKICLIFFFPFFVGIEIPFSEEKIKFWDISTDT